MTATTQTSVPNPVDQLIAEANEAVRAAALNIEQSTATLARYGIDVDAVVARLSPEQKREVQRRFEADMRQVEEAVFQARSHQSFQRPAGTRASAGSARRARYNLV